MNLANKLTLFRVILIPFFLLALYFMPEVSIVSCGIFVVASLTDFLDGYIARSQNMVTNFGKFMDPLADKLLVAAALIYFVEVSVIPAWIVIIIISREFVISGIRLVAASDGKVIAAGIWGKIKTAITMIMIIYLLMNFSFTFANVIGQILVYLSLLFTILSAADYIWANRKIFKDM